MYQQLVINPKASKTRTNLIHKSGVLEVKTALPQPPQTKNTLQINLEKVISQLKI